MPPNHTGLHTVICHMELVLNGNRDVKTKFRIKSCDNVSPLPSSSSLTMYDLLNQALDSLVGYRAGRISARGEFQDITNSSTSALVSLSPSWKSANRLRDAGYSNVQNFIVLPSLGAPRWLLPQRNLAAGTQIYEPCTRTGRIMKNAFLRLISTGWNGSVSQKALIASKGALPLEILTAELTGERSPIFALSLGRQPAVRKLTIQVMRPSGEILGYIKLPLTPLAVQRVRHEAEVLQRLWQFPVLRPHIPQLLHAGSWNEAYLLFQSPLTGEVGTKSFAPIHEQFLDTLRSVHSVNGAGPHLVEKVALNWKKFAPLLGAKWQALAGEVLRRTTMNLDGATLHYGVMHGDFTPWNIRTREQRLLLFDWESADWEAPVVWDRLHFHVQTGFLLNKRRDHAFTIGGNGIEEALYLLYLLNSVPQFVEEKNQAAIHHRAELITRQLSNEASRINN